MNYIINPIDVTPSGDCNCTAACNCYQGNVPICGCKIGHNPCECNSGNHTCKVNCESKCISFCASDCYAPSSVSSPTSFNF